MFPLGLLLILVCTLNCLVTSAPSVQIDVNESSPHSQHSLDYDYFPFSWGFNHPIDTHEPRKLDQNSDGNAQPEHHFTVDKQSRKPKIEYLNDNSNFHSGKETSLNNPIFQWHPYSFNHFPHLNLPSFESQTMLPFPKFRYNWPTFGPFSPMDTQNFPTLPPLSEMDEENFPSLPLFPSKYKRPFPTLPPRNRPNNFPTLPPLGPFPTLPPLPSLPTQKLPTFPPFPTMKFPTLPPFTLLGKQNKLSKKAPMPPADTQTIEESPSTKKLYDNTEESVIMKIRFYDSKEADKEEPLQPNPTTHRPQEQTYQYISRGNNETEGINVLNHLFKSFFPIDALTNKEAIDALTNKEEVPVNDSLLDQETSTDITVIGVPLKCSRGTCFCPRLHYYDSYSGRCLHQNSVWNV